MAKTIFVISMLFVLSQVQAKPKQNCNRFTHCSEECIGADGLPRWGLFCMWGTSCDYSTHRCEKNNAKVGNFPTDDGSEPGVENYRVINYDQESDGTKLEIEDWLREISNE